MIDEDDEFDRAVLARGEDAYITLKAWRLSNFKSVKDAEVDLLPLTVLVGANSAGKSTLIQSILATSQAAAASPSGDRFPLNGTTIRLGTVTQTRYAGPCEVRPTSFSLGGQFQLASAAELYRGGPVPETIRARQRFQRRIVAQRVDWQLVLGEAPEGQSGHAYIEEVHFSVSGIDTETDHRLGLCQLNARAAPADWMSDAEAAADRHLIGSYTSGTQKLDLVDVTLRGGLPMNGIVRESKSQLLWQAWRDCYMESSSARRRYPAERAKSDDTSTDQNWAELEDLVVGDITSIWHRNEAELKSSRHIFLAVRTLFEEKYGKEHSFSVDANKLIDPAFGSAVMHRLNGSAITGEVPVVEPLQRTSIPVRAILNFLRSRVRYLGPLREDPRVVYQDSAEAATGYIGAKGEFLAAVLQNSGSRFVDVPLPGTKNRVGATSRVKLKDALNQWVGYLKLGDRIDTHDQGRLGLELQIQQQFVDVDLDLTSVGTGVSQLLPVLVLCLEAPRGSLVLIEQPELHLNPAVQQRLADFLLAIAASNRQLIVETHSEYLVSRLRLRIAEDESDTVRDSVGLLFTEQTEGRTTYRPVETNEYGGIDNWPADFFDQSAAESRAILEAALQKRRKRTLQTE
ncbi:DUF3696 domain-containing protein [Mycobacterium sp. SMC-8]|uniref:AAA family ATPase n=1 Tax=Mycobacterium sp. SMC-8 TaxID=2857060 RepID=UPI0021B3924F|nr:DUF3696 domain-containing protein [Mycobacterium sp. SMC-8]UXA14088.1 DUF3696 domain-containing protein [Mycobacterium sp. SMC-8]